MKPSKFYCWEILCNFFRALVIALMLTVVLNKTFTNKDLIFLFSPLARIIVMVTEFWIKHKNSFCKDDEIVSKTSGSNVTKHQHEKKYLIFKVWHVFDSVLYWVAVQYWVRLLVPTAKVVLLLLIILLKGDLCCTDARL